MTGVEDELPPDERFTLVERVGAGGMGVVFKVVDRERGGVVALKTLRAMGPGGILRLKHEFRALADVTHPNLIALHELVQRGERCFFTMEYVEGESFLHWVRRDLSTTDAQTSTSVAGATTQLGSTDATRTGAIGALAGASSSLEAGRAAGLPDVPRLRDSFAQLAAGVAALHAAGKLHRDIKPSNVRVTPEGRVVLLDFGLATEVKRLSGADGPASVGDLDGPGTVAGTAGYMAPEQGAGRAVAPASDWYAVGVMLYEALTGYRPFAGRPREILADQQQRDVIAPDALVPGLPEDLVQLCVQLLDRDPARRPAGAEVLRRLGAALDTPSTRTDEIALVGRGLELAALEAAFERSRGGAVVALVHGPSGIGKSRLVHGFLETLRGRALVLQGRCHERESVPFKAIDPLIDALCAHLLALPRATAEALLPADTPALLRVFPVLWRVDAAAHLHRDAAPLADVHEVRRRAFAALRELLGRLAARAPLVLFVDDLQWGDADSAALLEALLAAPAPPLLFVGCHRADEPARRPVLRALLAPRPDTKVIDLALGPLGDDDARALASRLCGDASGASAVAREAGGSPFFLQQLAAMAQAGAAPAGDVDLDEMLRGRVTALAEAARRLLAVIALAAGPIPQTVALVGAGLARRDLDEIERLRAARLVRTHGARGRDAVECYHDRIRDAALAHVSPDERRALHGQLAHALERDPGHAEALAEHFHEAGDLAEASRWAAQAAERASAALAFDRAVELYRRAIEWRGDGRHDERGGTDDDRRGLHARLADALVAAGRGHEAARAYLEAARGAPPAEALVHRHRAAEQLMHAGHIDEGSATLRAVLAEIGLHAPETRAGALASLLETRARIALTGHRHRLRRADEIPPEDLRRIDVCWSAMTGFSVTSHLRATAFQARHALEALRAGEPGRLAIAYAGEAFFYAHEARGADLAARAFALAARVEDPAVDATVRLLDGWRHIELGRWTDARDQLLGADRLFRERCTGHAWARDTAQVFAGIAMGHLGQLAAQQQHAVRIRQDSRTRGDFYLEASLPFHLFMADLSGDEPDRLRAAVRAAEARGLPREFGIQHWGAVQAESSAALYVGDARTALARVENAWPALRRSLLLGSVAFRREARMVRGRALVAAFLAGDRRRLDEAAAVARQLERDRTGATRAMGALLAACVTAARGDAASAFARAAAALDAEGMAMLAAAARWRLGELQGGADGQTRIADARAAMVAEGVRRPERLLAVLAPAP